MIASYFELFKKFSLSNFKRLPFPYKLTFAITYRCNSRCKTCNIWGKKISDELSTEEIERFFKISHDLSWIDLTGGEPTLRKDFADICRIIHMYCKNLVLLHFPTNGYLTNKIIDDVKKIKMLGGSYKVVITVSVDGDEKINDDIRGVPGAWKKQVDTFLQLHEFENIEPVFGMTLSPFNFDRLEDTFNSLKAVIPWLTSNNFHISLMNYSENFYDNMQLKKLMLEEQERKKIVEGMIRSIKKYRSMIGLPKTPRLLLEYIFLKHAENFLRTERSPLPCHALKSSCFIDPTGEVFPCITFNQSLGNLRDYDYDLMKIWNLDTTKALQRKAAELNCPQCWTGCDGYQTIMGNVRHLFKGLN